jgi:hypothetical protein
VSRLLLGAALGLALAWLVAELDRRLVESFIAREQMTVRPRPRYRRPPTVGDWMAG